MAGIVELRNAGGTQGGAHLGHALLLTLTLERAFLEMLDRSQRTGGNRRGQRRGEDETGGEAAHEIAQRLGRRDIATNDTVGLGQRAFDHGQFVHQAFAFGNAAAARAIHANGMDFVDIGHSAMLLGHVADFLDGRDVAIHRIDTFKRHQLGHFRTILAQQPVQIFRVIVLEHMALGAAVADAFDHGGMVQRVGEDNAAGDLGGQRGQRSPVRDITRCEQQRIFLAVQIRQFQFELAVHVHGA